MAVILAAAAVVGIGQGVRSWPARLDHSLFEPSTPRVRLVHELRSLRRNRSALR